MSDSFFSQKISARISERIIVHQQILQDAQLMGQLETIVDLTTIALKADKKIVFCGNGGSAADAQHLAAELSGRYYLDRQALDAEALHVNSSALTAVANDYDFASAYARLLQAKARPGDVLFALSTSGNSPNILRAIEQAKRSQMIVVGMSGHKGGKMKDRCDYLIRIPSSDVPCIQECHLMLGHLICELVEQRIFE